jgi:hypothetical protein
LETPGLTRTGLFEYRSSPHFKDNPLKRAAEGIRNRGGGPYLSLSRFGQEDVVGPFGYATPCGIRNGKKHRLRLVVSSGIMELYLDDRFVQAYKDDLRNIVTARAKLAGLHEIATKDGRQHPAI